MGWATKHIERLRAGETVQFRPLGHSMEPRVKHRALVTVEPIADHATLAIGDVVLCKVHSRGRTCEYLHLVVDIHPSTPDGRMFLIGNNRGGLNGWTRAQNVFGKCVKIE